MGFRNPWRAKLMDEAAWSDAYPEHPHISEGKPGRIGVSDVGLGTYEEVNIVDLAGFNGGWPMYEGMDLDRSDGTLGPERLDSVVNTDAGDGVNPGTCKFTELLLVDTRSAPTAAPSCTGASAISWVNKYYGFAGTVPIFKHARSSAVRESYTIRHSLST